MTTLIIQLRNSSFAKSRSGYMLGLLGIKRIKKYKK